LIIFSARNPGAHLETRALRTQLILQNETNKHVFHCIIDQYWCIAIHSDGPRPLLSQASNIFHDPQAQELMESSWKAKMHFPHLFPEVN